MRQLDLSFGLDEPIDPWRLVALLVSPFGLLLLLVCLFKYRSNLVKGAVPARADIHSLADRFGVREAGFLLERPCQQLPAKYKQWEDLAQELPYLLRAKRFREWADRLKPISGIEELEYEQQWRAMLLLAVFAHSYVFGMPQIASRIPKGIAVPLHQVSSQLGVPPVLSHSAIVLANYRLLDGKGPRTTNNFAILQGFLGGADESWFFMLTAEIEAVGAKAIPPLLKLQDLAGANTPALQDTLDEWEIQTTSEEPWKEAAAVVALSELRSVHSTMKQLVKLMNRMEEQCNPWVFYHRIRPFLSGWLGNPRLPAGMEYEGVWDTPKRFAGGSAAQSSLLPFLDATLGVSHSNSPSRHFLQRMRKYMPPAHRTFLGAVEARGSIREAVLATAQTTTYQDKTLPKDIEKTYNDCISLLSAFRAAHKRVVVRFIMDQQTKEHSNRSDGLEKAAGDRGTGGTGILDFLEPVEASTADARIHQHQRDASYQG